MYHRILAIAVFTICAAFPRTLPRAEPPAASGRSYFAIVQVQPGAFSFAGKTVPSHVDLIREATDPLRIPLPSPKDSVPATTYYHRPGSAGSVLRKWNWFTESTTPGMAGAFFAGSVAALGPDSFSQLVLCHGKHFR